MRRRRSWSSRDGRARARAAAPSRALGLAAPDRSARRGRGGIGGLAAGRPAARRSRRGSHRPATTVRTRRPRSSARRRGGARLGCFAARAVAARRRRARVRARPDPGLGRLDDGEPPAADVRRRRRGARSRSRGSSSASDGRARELGPLAWPLALFVGWTGRRVPLDARTAAQGAIYLLFFVLPFALLAVSLARLPWVVGWVMRSTSSSPRWRSSFAVDRHLPVRRRATSSGTRR